MQQTIKTFLRVKRESNVFLSEPNKVAVYTLDALIIKNPLSNYGFIVCTERHKGIIQTTACIKRVKIHASVRSMILFF